MSKKIVPLNKEVVKEKSKSQYEKYCRITQCRRYSCSSFEPFKTNCMSFRDIL